MALRPQCQWLLLTVAAAGMVVVAAGIDFGSILRYATCNEIREHFNAYNHS
jgi:hypothetical protein